MYQASYAEVLQDDAREARRNERRAFQRAISLLDTAARAGAAAPEAEAALSFTTRLWSILISDLASGGNDLPDVLRARLMSIGLWILKEARRIQQGECTNFAGIGEVCQLVCDGLD